ncbi:mRNA export protein [Yarrowia sp. C11]|nr:mRNA export protein [Yarrowia sp. C11]
MSNLDQSLDEIISAAPKRNNRKGGRRGASGAAGNGGVQKATPAAPKAGATKNKQQKQQQQKRVAAIVNPIDEAKKLASKVIISNLPQDIGEDAIRDYFKTEIGPITACTMVYNRGGHPAGIVNVTFKRPGDAAKAADKFNGTSIDRGKRYMKVELVYDPSKTPLSARLHPKPEPAPAKATVNAAAKAKQQQQQQKKKASKPKPKKAPKKTVEELDAEMADYFQD